ncbi:restriction endonuclease subunit S [Corynebacterium coyleae]|uniref:Type I restriction endonuclease subunit S n=1 Tax=Corynebacterium coyleae TaxID=53374 RepID=A0AAP7CDG5_9CORY|nr:restriction endonuclease subunit S [Corynebacterium coyleae]NJJ04939.1 type I restriction endonuclease subunit S [Corynebacterium coyleae]
MTDWKRHALSLVISETFAGEWGSDEKSDQIDVPCVRVADFNRETQRVADEVPTIRSYSEAKLASKQLKIGDILIEKSGGGEKTPVGSAIYFDGPEGLMCTNFIQVLRLRNGHDPRFWTYALRMKYARGETYRLINQTTGIQNLDMREYFGQKFHIPDLETQRRIADYLDKEISEMDAMIEEFERLISSLESRRGVYLQSKFDPEITGEPSLKMGTFAQISLGKTFQGEPREGQKDSFPVNYVRAANIQPHGQLVLDEQTMYATQDEVEKYTLKAGDVVIVEGGAGFGRSLTLQEDLPGWIFQNHVIRLIPRSGWLGEFFDYTIRAHLYSGYIELQTVGATIPGLSSERAANLPVAFVTLEEQQKRVIEAREELDRMDSLIEESTRLIANLKARKTALITELVTGRKEV